MIEKIIADRTSEAMREIFGQQTDPALISVQKTHPEFTGDLTVVVFPLTRISKKSPEETGKLLGNYLATHLDEVEGFNVVKGFLNLEISQEYWLKFFREHMNKKDYGSKVISDVDPVLIEFSSPNTNKPLHLGHIRNNLLGWSLTRILKANGLKVAGVNLVNDRGIHICKTMCAYREWAGGKDPHHEGIKGDKFVGSLYVDFEQANKSEISKLREQGLSEEEAYRNSPFTKQALEILQRWEENDPDIRKLWQKMNVWVYEGFDKTYSRMGISFDKIYYESDTYLLGKELVLEGLDKGIFYKATDGSVWVDLKDFKLDEKLLQRADGTSVYITQDLGTAQLRYDDYHPQRMLYVVGNEQNYHFDVLKIVLKLLERPWADDILHVSYGMVELPSGRMKSREGTVVDADDLMDEMHATAKKMTTELGKSEGLDIPEAEKLYEMIGMGALKYFILRVDPRKNMMFNPEESIDFNGNTGPFIQYTHARIRSLIRKAEERGIHSSSLDITAIHEILPKEKEIIKLLYEFPCTVGEAGKGLSPALIAAYAYDLAKEYNQFYQEIPVLREPDPAIINFRLALSSFTADIIRKSMDLLGIEVPEKM